MSEDSGIKPVGNWDMVETSSGKIFNRSRILQSLWESMILLLGQMG